MPADHPAGVVAPTRGSSWQRARAPPSARRADRRGAPAVPLAARLRPRLRRRHRPDGRARPTCAFAVENMFPWRAAAGRSRRTARTGTRPTSDYRDYTLDLSHTAVSGSDALAMVATDGRPARARAPRRRHRARPRTSTWSPGRGAQPCAECWSGWPARGSPARWSSRSTPAAAATGPSGRPTSPRRWPSPGSHLAADRRRRGHRLTRSALADPGSPLGTPRSKPSVDDRADHPQRGRPVRRRFDRPSTRSPRPAGWSTGPDRHPRPPRRGHHRPPSRPPPRATPTCELLGAARRPRASAPRPRCRSSCRRSARRCPATATRSRSTTSAPVCRGGRRGRHHGHPRHGGPHHHRLDAGASCASCATDFPETGAVLQAYLRRTEDDCRDLAHAGSPGPAVQGRVRGARVRRVPGQGATSTSRTSAA